MQENLPGRYPPSRLMPKTTPGRNAVRSDKSSSENIRKSELHGRVRSVVRMQDALQVKKTGFLYDESKCISFFLGKTASVNLTT